MASEPLSIAACECLHEHCKSCARLRDTPTNELIWYMQCLNIEFNRRFPDLFAASVATMTSELQDQFAALSAKVNGEVQ